MSVIEKNALFHVPYNGDVSLSRTTSSFNNWKVYGPWVIAWYGEDHRIARAGTVHHRVSQVSLLRAIYRAGYQVLTMSRKDIQEQGKRPYSGGIYPKRVVVITH